MSSEPDDNDYALAALHSRAESDVRRIEYEMSVIRLEWAQQLRALEQQLQAARHVLTTIQPQYDSMMARLDTEQEDIEECH